ncbi:MAG: hypothetical protein JO127_15195 [Caulobacteraceae bacterium]|nr:hypothetical protein [Caulobacteraceae bacterium]
MSQPYDPDTVQPPPEAPDRPDPGEPAAPLEAPDRPDPTPAPTPPLETPVPPTMG